MGAVRPWISILRRVWCVPAILPVTVLAVGATVFATMLARVALGGAVADARQGALLFAGALFLSLCEPLEIGREARGGPLVLVAVRRRGLGLPTRALALLLGSLPVLGLAALASGGWPADPVGLIGSQLVLSMAGLFLGAFVDRALLVPALWGLVVVGHLRPWIAAGPAAPLAWLLPGLGELRSPVLLAHALVWGAGLLCLAQWRLERVVARAA